MIRQAISCDICASEKKQTNHWFVAFEQGGELRLSGWNSRNRLRQGMKHLCGQTCLHKLVDEFMARTIDIRAIAGSVEEPGQPVQALPAPAQPSQIQPSQIQPSQIQPGQVLNGEGRFSPDSGIDIAETEETQTTVRPLIHPQPLLPRQPLRPPTELVAMPVRQPARESASPEEPSRYISRNWRAEAWDRERERELRAAERRPESARRPEIAARRRSGS